MSQSQPTNLMEHHNRLIAEVLSRVSKLVAAATEPATSGLERATDVAAMGSSRLQMQLEQEALITAVKSLLTLSRRIKELWVFGPAGASGTVAGTEPEAGRDASSVASPAAGPSLSQINNDIEQVARLIGALEEGKAADLAGQSGGAWRKEIAAAANSMAAAVSSLPSSSSVGPSGSGGGGDHQPGGSVAVP